MRLALSSLACTCVDVAVGPASISVAGTVSVWWGVGALLVGLPDGGALRAELSHSGEFPEANVAEIDSERVALRLKETNGIDSPSAIRVTMKLRPQYRVERTNDYGTKHHEGHNGV